MDGPQKLQDQHIFDSSLTPENQWRTVTFLTGCSLFKNTYYTLGGVISFTAFPDPPFVAAMLAAPLTITDEDLQYGDTTSNYGATNNHI